MNESILLLVFPPLAFLLVLILIELRKMARALKGREVRSKASLPPARNPQPITLE